MYLITYCCISHGILSCFISDTILQTTSSLLSIVADRKFSSARLCIEAYNITDIGCARTNTCSERTKPSITTSNKHG